MLRDVEYFVQTPDFAGLDLDGLCHVLSFRLLDGRLLWG